MIYLFETEHFLLREKRPGDVIRSALKQDCSRNKSIPEILIIESRTTGAPAGEVLIKTSGGSSGEAEIRCFLYEKFRKDRFEKEIVDMLRQKSVILPPLQSEAHAQLSPAAYQAPFPRPVPEDKEHV